MTSVALPGAIWDTDGLARRELTLRPVGGEDQLFLLDSADRLGPSERATALLERCIVTGGQAGYGTPGVGSLTAGDREAALLHLRRLTLGERLDAVLPCPNAACGEPMELGLLVGDLLVPPDPEPRREHELGVVAGGESITVRFRLPATDDLAAAGRLAIEDPRRAEDELLRRCVLAVTSAGRPLPLDALADDVRDAIGAAMADRDPQAVVELDLACPACGEQLAVPFDAGLFLVQELDARGDHLLEEVHVIASQYHWSERDILALPAGRRWRYLEMIAASRAGGSDDAWAAYP